MITRLRFLILIAVCVAIIVGCKNHVSDQSMQDDIFVSPLGKKLIVPEPTEKMLDQYEKAKKDFESDPDNLNNFIWYGRRTAYLGKYEEAIIIFSKGIEKFPTDPHLYRHRGHRYISIRKFDKAINDLEYASELIQGTENEIEPDGMPNAMNIPVSTLHGNIWYHLGLAYYLEHNYEQAFEAYLKCRETVDNYDNIVSSTHWLYMIQRRMRNTELAEKMLDPIHLGDSVIENTDYYDLCKFYKGLIPIESFKSTKEDSPSSNAIKYGIANWYFYNGEKEKARKMMDELLTSKSWSSFGYIAAESDLIEYYR